MEDHHDIILVGHDGGMLARLRITDGEVSPARLLELVAAHGESTEAPLPAAIKARAACSSRACSRAQQDAAWDRVAAHKQAPLAPAQSTSPASSRSSPTQSGVTRLQTRATLAAAPAPANAAELTLAQLRTLLPKAGFWRSSNASRLTSRQKT